jgi:hypothetical protein
MKKGKWFARILFIRAEGVNATTHIGRGCTNDECPSAHQCPRGVKCWWNKDGRSCKFSARTFLISPGVFPHSCRLTHGYTAGMHDPPISSIQDSDSASDDENDANNDDDDDDVNEIIFGSSSNADNSLITVD